MSEYRDGECQPVGFKSPDGAQPPPQPSDPAPPKPAPRPILRLVQKFWRAGTTKVTTKVPQQSPITTPTPPDIPPPPPPEDTIRIEASKDPETWLFSTIPDPIGIEGMVRALDREEAFQKVTEAVRQLSLRCKTDEIISMALLVNQEALVAATRMTPDDESGG